MCKRLKIRIGKVTGFTFDISPRGTGVELTKTLLPGTAIDGAIFLDAKELGFAGQVRWARAGQANLGIRARMGILLTSISNEFFELFME